MIALTKVVDDTPELVLPWKCCQLIFRPQYQVMFEEDTVENENDETKRGEGGFGSSSTKEDRRDHMDNMSTSMPDTP
jgi:hypothetical protein